MPINFVVDVGLYLGERNLNHLIGLLLFIVLGIGAVPSAFAQNLSEPGLFSRCYSQLTGKPVPLNHAVMNQIKAGAKSALTACSELLDKATLGGDGYLTNRYDSEARAVLSNLNKFHRSWFSANTVEQIQDFNNEISIGTSDVFDATEPGLSITRAVFAQNGRYDEVLTLPTGVTGLREDNPTWTTLYGYIYSYPTRRLAGNNVNFANNGFHFMPVGGVGFTLDGNNVPGIGFPVIQVGDLIGVKATSNYAVVPNVSMEPLGNAGLRGDNEPGLNYSYNFYQTQGGGVLGSPIYVLLNFGHGRNLKSDGGYKLPRRWSQTNMNTFLCASLPALRESDVASMVISSSSLSFRQASSCVQCHANLDQMASTIRNSVMANSNYGRTNPEYHKTTLLLPQYRPELGAVGGWPSEPVANYHRTAPTGKLFFRSMTGELVDRSVANVSELGAAMTQTSDYYTCAAKRYFEFFTGISVALYDRTNPANASLNKTLSEQSIRDRKYVEGLGEELRRSQSVKSVIKQIMTSDYYRAINYRAD